MAEMQRMNRALEHFERSLGLAKHSYFESHGIITFDCKTREQPNI